MTNYLEIKTVRNEEVEKEEGGSLLVHDRGPRVGIVTPGAGGRAADLLVLNPVPPFRKERNKSRETRS